MGSALASVIIVNVRLCRDAFKGRFREGVCTYFGGACESNFCHCCVVAFSLVYKVSMIKVVICEPRMSVYKGWSDLGRQ